MTPDQALAFVVFAFVAAVTPGPSNIILAATGAAAGVRRGLPCLGGVVTGMGLLLFVVAFGLGSLVLDRPFVLDGLRWGGAGVLLWLAWSIATSGRPGSAHAPDLIGVRRAALLQWVNPKAWLVAASAAGTYLQADASSALVQSALFGLLFVAAAAPGCLVWLAGGATLQRWVRTDRAARAVNVAMGAALAGSIVLVL